MMLDLIVRLLFQYGLFLSAPPLLAAPEPPPAPRAPRPAKQPAPAEAFLKTLAASDSTAEKRREAWAALREAERRMPKSVAAAIERSRRRAWRRLRALIASSAVRKTASGLLGRLKPHQEKARAVVRGAGFDKLGQAMAPIQRELDDALEALRNAKGYERTRALLDEFETYAAEAGLRTGWSDELGDTLAALLLVTRYVGGSATKDVVAHNLRIGDIIDPAEHACVARLNVHRLLLGIPPAELDLRLVAAAKKHAEEMVAKRYFSHTSPTPGHESPWKRAAREGARSHGECIAGAGPSGVAAFRGWYHSQGHHKIMIVGATVGVGRAGGTWTLLVGSSRLRGAAATKFAQYMRQRYRAGDDAERLYKLARWCAPVGFTAQARDELERAVALDPEHEQAKKALEAMRGGGR